MKPLPSGLQDHLDSGATTLCWCWRIMRKDGVVLGFTDHDCDVEFDGVLHEAQTGFTGSEVQTQLGLAPDNAEVSGALRSDRISETDLLLGRYDGATVDLYRVNWVEPSQHVRLRRMLFGEVRHGKHAFTAELRGLSARLSEVKGRLFQHGCSAMLGDARCGVNLSSSAYRATGTLEAVHSATRFEINYSGSYDDNFFAHGRLEFISGALDRLSYDIKDNVKTSGGATVSLWIGPEVLPEPGDDVRLYAGCDKSFDTCRSKFSNGLNYQGFPHIPGNDFVFRFPRQDEAANDGGSLFNE
ncbi:MAG: DUF2163 domain-containing protein [Pseudomonadota bacterium]